MREVKTVTAENQVENRENFQNGCKKIRLKEKMEEKT